GVEAAAVAVAESGGEGVEARELTGRIDPEMRIILGVSRKNTAGKVFRRRLAGKDGGGRR
ncbi:hypothetical protein Tco_0419764, partial [Tanacetum coccineum]